VVADRDHDHDHDHGRGRHHFDSCRRPDHRGLSRRHHGRSDASGFGSSDRRSAGETGDAGAPAGQGRTDGRMLCLFMPFGETPVFTHHDGPVTPRKSGVTGPFRLVRNEFGNALLGLFRISLRDG
jgi:hypothetical protein